MDVTMLNRNTLKINGVYHLTIEEYENIKEHEELVDKLSVRKKDFIEVVKKDGNKRTLIRSFLRNALFYSELETERDMIDYDYKELAEMIEAIGSHGVFTSRGTYDAYLNGVYLYTKWGYDHRLRKDIVTADEINSIVSYEKVVYMDAIEQKILTFSEMDMLIVKCENELTKMCLIAAKESLTINELVRLESENFKSTEKHPITTYKRTINISDKLYNMFKEYSEKKTQTVTINGKSFERDFEESRYVIKKLRREDSKKSVPFSTNFLATKITADLKSVGSIANFNDFRTSTMLYDYINDMILEDLNKKYMKKTHHLGVYKNKYEIEISILEEKLFSEKNK